MEPAGLEHGQLHDGWEQRCRLFLLLLIFLLLLLLPFSRTARSGIDPYRQKFSADQGVNDHSGGIPAQYDVVPCTPGRGRGGGGGADAFGCHRRQHNPLRPSAPSLMAEGVHYGIQVEAGEGPQGGGEAAAPDAARSGGAGGRRRGSSFPHRHLSALRLARTAAPCAPDVVGSGRGRRRHGLSRDLNHII